MLLFKRKWLAATLLGFGVLCVPMSHGTTPPVLGNSNGSTNTQKPSPPGDSVASTLNNSPSSTKGPGVGRNLATGLPPKAPLSSDANSGTKAPTVSAH